MTSAYYKIKWVQNRGELVFKSNAYTGHIQIPHTTEKQYHISHGNVREYSVLVPALGVLMFLRKPFWRQQTKAYLFLLPLYWLPSKLMPKRREPNAHLAAENYQKLCDVDFMVKLLISLSVMFSTPQYVLSCFWLAVGFCSNLSTSWKHWYVPTTEKLL